MDQLSFAEAEYASKRRERFLEEMDRLLPWNRLEAKVRPHYHRNRTGRRPYPLDRCHLKMPSRQKTIPQFAPSNPVRVTLTQTTDQNPNLAACKHPKSLFEWRT